MLALGLALMTSGCGLKGTDRSKPTPGLSGIPQMNPKYRISCKEDKPKNRVGKDARQLIYEYDAAVDKCDGKRKGAVAHNDSVMKRWPR